MVAAAFLMVLAGGYSESKDSVIRQTCDVIEINHFCDCRGGLVFDQVIFWQWVPQLSEYRVMAWRILKDVREESPKRQTPAADGWTPRPPWKGGHAAPVKRRDARGWWVSTWWDEVDQCFRQVAAPQRRETWTQYDPELLDRANLPENQRVGLTRPEKPAGPP